MFSQNYRMFLTVFLSAIFFSNIVFADPTDGCELGGNELFVTTEGVVLYNAAEPIGGFQFNVDGIISATGGAAADAGFTVSTGGNTVLGFSFSGASIPAGEGVLTTITVAGSDPCISGVVISGAGGVALDTSSIKIKDLIDFPPPSKNIFFLRTEFKIVFGTILYKSWQGP